MISFRLMGSQLDDLDEVQGLLNEIFPKAMHINRNYLDWCYFQNPTGRILAINAYADGQLVGHCAGQPIPVRIHGKEEIGLISIHAAVRSKHRVCNGVQIYNSLIDRLVSAGTAAGFGFLIGIMNAATTRFIRRRRKDFEIIAAMDAMLGLGATPAGVDENQIQFKRLWDEQTLNWRLARPGSNYTVLERAGQCTVYAQTSIPGLTAELGRFGVQDSLFRLPRGSGFSPIHLWLGLDATRNWRSKPYMKIPNRFRPSPLYLAYSDFSGGGRSLDAKSILINPIDLDAF